MTINTAALLAYGEQQVGKPYVFGTAGPNTFDCSGLIQYMFSHFGLHLPHHAADQAALGTPVAKTAIAPADLVFSDWGDGPNSHVGIATDAGHILVAPHTGTNVTVQPLTANYMSKITAVRRLPGLTAETGPHGTISGAVRGGSSSGSTTAPAGSSAAATPGPAPEGAPSWLTGAELGISGALSGVNSGLAGIWNKLAEPVVSGVDGIGASIAGLGQAAAVIALPFEAFGWLLNPNHALRAAAFAIGAAMIIGGLVLLVKEARS